MGPDTIPSLFTLPSGISLTTIVSAVHLYRCEDVPAIIEHVIDRPMEEIADNQREALHMLLTLSAVSYQQCARVIQSMLQDIRTEWSYMDLRDDHQLEAYQDSVWTGVHQYLTMLTSWYIPCCRFQQSLI